MRKYTFMYNNNIYFLLYNDNKHCYYTSSRIMRKYTFMYKEMFVVITPHTLLYNNK